MIFIAYNRESYPVGIVSAVDEKSATAYWQGANLNYNLIKSFDITQDRENEKEGFVTPILKTKEVDAYHFRNSDNKLLLIDK